MLAYFPVWRRNYLCNIKKEVFPLKHRICSLRATLAAALVLVILFVPALAAEITVDYVGIPIFRCRCGVSKGKPPS